jgi:hypothetical protein
MSKYKIVSTIQRELEKINERIDMKILQGQSYRKEAKQHKVLMSQLRHAGGGFRFFSFF